MTDDREWLEFDEEEEEEEEKEDDFQGDDDEEEGEDIRSSKDWHADKNFKVNYFLDQC